MLYRSPSTAKIRANAFCSGPRCQPEGGTGLVLRDLLVDWKILLFPVFMLEEHTLRVGQEGLWALHATGEHHHATADCTSSPDNCSQRRLDAAFVAVRAA